MPNACIMDKMNGMFNPTEGIDMNIEDLKNPELQEKLMSAKTAGELAALAKAEGIALSDEQMDAVAGGQEWNEFTEYYEPCGKCGKRISWYDSTGRPNFCPYCGDSIYWED